MIRRYLVILLTFYLPLLYLPTLVSGFLLSRSFPIIAAVAAILAACCILSVVAIEFLTIRKNFWLKSLVTALFVAGGVYLTYKGLHLIAFSVGSILMPFTLPVHIGQLSLIENIVITSLLLSIWGIICNRLVK